MGEDEVKHISISPLLRRLWPSPGKHNVTAEEIALAISYIFENRLSPVQTGALLTCLHFTEWDIRPDVLAKCAEAMRNAAFSVDTDELMKVVKARGRPDGDYRGGLCDIVGTGGDSHNTFNVSTTSSIVASSLVMMSKHGGRASTSKSGSADLLQVAKPTAPNINAINPATIAKIYEKSNYAFLFAPVFHPGMKYAASIRKELGWRTIFNLLGPLANPLNESIEARLIGVARRDIGPVFAEALQMSGTTKAMVVCGDEELDEISCAGRTHCWRLVEGRSDHSDVDIVSFTILPADFGLPEHPLEDVAPGQEPHENAELLVKLLQNKMANDDPIFHFVLINTAALFVIAGVCEADDSSLGPSDDGVVIRERGPGGGRWKEGVRRARWAIESGEAWKQWQSFVDISNSFNS